MPAYPAALEYLLGRVNFERNQADAMTTQSLKLERMQAFLKRLGHPELAIPAIHVAGTKGKGSTCVMIEAMLRSAGVRTGLYTSPHIERLEERFLVDGEQCSPDELGTLVDELKPVIAGMDSLGPEWHPTFFEVITALAWLHFRRRGVEVVVLEVGLGGRLDSTNLCKPLVTVITTISRDHTHILGATTGLIAREKAGILKPGIPLVCGVTDTEALREILAIAASHAVPVWQWGDEISLRAERNKAFTVVTPTVTVEEVSTPLVGDHQRQNAAVAIAAVEQFRRSWSGPGSRFLEWPILKAGLQRVVWPGRIEVLPGSPPLVLDAAHNWESTKALIRTLPTIPSLHGPRILVFGATRDKDTLGILRLLLPHFDEVILTRYHDNSRATSLGDLQAYVESLADRPLHAAEYPAEALNQARRMAGDQGVIVVTGSFFLIAEVRPLLVSGGPRASSPSGTL